VEDDGPVDDDAAFDDEPPVEDVPVDDVLLALLPALHAEIPATPRLARQKSTRTEVRSDVTNGVYRFRCRR